MPKDYHEMRLMMLDTLAQHVNQIMLFDEPDIANEATETGVVIKMMANYVMNDLVRYQKIPEQVARMHQKRGLLKLKEVEPEGFKFFCESILKMYKVEDIPADLLEIIPPEMFDNKDIG